LVPLVNAVNAHPALTWVCARNEHDAATMAAAHAKYTGGLGVVIATSGPGATNLTTGLLEAVLDRVSLWAITGMKPTAVLGYSEFQDVSQSRLFAGAGVEWSKEAASADAVIPLLRDGVSTALTRRTCAHLAIPVDIQSAPSPLPLKHFCASHANLRLSPPKYDADLIHAAAAMLVGSPEERPQRNVIAVGLRACPVSTDTTTTTTTNNISQVILDLAEALNAPVLTRLDAKGVVDETHPLSYGVIGVHGKPGLEAAACLISSADCIVSIGVEDETLLLCNSAGLQIRKLVEIQPDAVVVGTRFNADHTLLGHVDQVCQALSERVETLMVKVDKKRAILQKHFEDSDPSNSSHGHYYDSYLHTRAHLSQADIDIPDLDQMDEFEFSNKCNLLWEALHHSDWKTLQKSGLRGPQTSRFVCEYDDHERYCHPASVLSALSDARRSSDTDPVSRQAVVAVDVGDVTLWASLCLQLQGGSRTLYSERLGTMGYALNAAIAGILAQDGPAGALVLAGDGGFQMTLQELATFQQMKRPGDKLLVIVFDNQVLGRVAFGFENAAGCDMIGPDYVQLVKAYGGDGIRLDSDDQAKDVVTEALKKEGLYLIHVIVNPHVKADMATFNDTALKVMNSG
jgi:thiamine pyrophosphate-dependent acetolactate synthase large subunit-like protein